MPLEGSEHDAEACAGGGRFVADRATAYEYEHLVVVCFSDEAIAGESESVYLNGEELDGRRGRCWGDEHALGICADVGNRCEEAAGKHRIKGGHWADWGLGKLGKGHGRSKGDVGLALKRN